MRRSTLSGGRGHRRLECECLEERRLLSFDPSGWEQASLEYINRMRTDPQHELGVLFSSVSPTLIARDPAVQITVELYGVSASALVSQFAGLSPVAPLAWNASLHDAAAAHNTAMMIADRQSHQLPGEPSLAQRIAATGYSHTVAGENVYAYASSVLFGHAGFAVDWRPGSPGIQSPPSHRNNIMGSSYLEVGIDVLHEFNDLTSVGPLLITQNFAARSNYNPQLLGVVWDDASGNGYFDPGEGLHGVSIVASGPAGTYATTSMSAGGYQMPLPPGTYEVTATGGILPQTLTAHNVVIGSDNVKVDFGLQPLAQAPTANNDQAIVDERGYTVVEVLANDRGSANGLITSSVRIVSPPQSGLASANIFNGTIYYRPSPGFVGTDTLTYQVTDRNGTVSNPALLQLSKPYPTGDFDRSGRVNGNDIDRIFAELNNRNPDPRFDLTSDGRVSFDDVSYLVEDILGTRFGDATLDGTVNVVDYVLWSLYRFSSRGGSWVRGDFNGDKRTDVVDFNIWLENQTHSGLVIAPSEPAGARRSVRVATSLVANNAVPLAEPSTRSREPAFDLPLPRTRREADERPRHVDRAKEKNATHHPGGWNPSEGRELTPRLSPTD